MTDDTMWRRVGLLAAVPIAFGLAACSGDGAPAGPEGTETLLLSVVPEGGATGVAPGEPITITFDHPMNPVMSEYADVHEGDVTGPEVEGVWSWSEGHTKLSFTPSSPFEPATTYTIHLGGGMRDAAGHYVNFEEHGGHMGGRWATSGMMGGGMGPGGGPGAGPGPGHMGEGWQHPTNGTYGMVFTFTTA